MNTGRRRLPGSTVLKLTFTTLAIALTQSGQQYDLPAGYSTDWTSRHLIFSNPGSIFDASRKGKLDRWLAVVGDPHYRMHLMRRAPLPPRAPFGRRPEHLDGASVDKDWSVQLSASSRGIQPNTFPAKFSFSATAAPSCSSDFVVYPTGAAGSSAQTSIIAYNNLYSGCSPGTVPSVLWAYNTGGTATTSPIISYDGTGSQIAFVQNSASSLVLLKWAASGGSATSPASIASVTAANYRSCAAPCYTTLALSSSAPYASPFPDYAHDIVYVADNGGKVHQFTGVFKGTPAENSTNWPVVVLNGAFLRSPVYDPASGNVFVSTSGNLYSVGTGFEGTTAGHLTTTGSAGDGLNDAPLVDSSGGLLYEFYASGTDTPNGDSTVVQFSTTFASGSIGNGASSPDLGQNENFTQYAGTFDNVYYSSSNQTGNLYVVGSDTNGDGIVYQVPISSGVMGAAVGLSLLSGLNQESDYSGENGISAPLAEFCNGAGAACAVSGGKTTTGTDYLFLSGVPGAGSGCTQDTNSGCVMALNISDPSSVSVAGSGLNLSDTNDNSCVATGGIIVDNSATSGTLAGASQIYFINLNGNDPTYCNFGGSSGPLFAVQASQSAP